MAPGTRLWRASLLLLIVLAGCQQGGGTAPALPPLPDAEYSQGQQSGLPVPFLAAELVLSEGPMGLTASLEPLRSATAPPPLGTRALVDAMGYLAGPLACYDCVRVTGISRLAPDTVGVTVAVRHPFPASSGRFDLHLFDVRGHLAGEGAGEAFPGLQVDLGAGPEPAQADVLISNADGYSTFYDGVALPALGLPRTAVNLRPYKLFWKDFNNGNFHRNNANGFADVTAPAGKSVFPVGGSFTDPRASATYAVTFPGGAPSQARFRLVLDVSYASTAPAGAPQSAKYFLPLFNQPAPVYLTADIELSELQAGDPQSRARLRVALGDWQADAIALDDPFSFSFATTPLDRVIYDSEPQGLRIDAPALLAAPIIRPLTSVNSGKGVPGDPYVFIQDVTNTLGAPAGTYYALLSTRDSLTVFPEALPWVVNRDGTTLSNWKDFATYQVVPLEVQEAVNLSPLAELLADKLQIIAGQSVQFCPGPGTFDPDGDIVLWEYDFDYDPTDPAGFEAEVSRTAADPDQCVDRVFTTFGFPHQIIFTVGMRVTDDGDPPRYGYDHVRITVDPF